MEFPFFHGKISRKACEDLLCKKGKNGSYLIRESETVAGALCLCVLTIEDISKDSLSEHHFTPMFLFLYNMVILCHIPALKKSSTLTVSSGNMKDVIKYRSVIHAWPQQFPILDTNLDKPETSEGVPQKVFKTLKDLIYNYEKPNQGLVTKLRYPVKKTSSSRRSQRFKTGNDDIYDEIDESDYVDVLS